MALLTYTELLQLQKQSLMLTDSSIINKAQGRRTRHGIPLEMVVNVVMDVFSPPSAHTAPWQQCESRVFITVCLSYILCLASMTSSAQMHNRLPYKLEHILEAIWVTSHVYYASSELTVSIEITARNRLIGVKGLTNCFSVGHKRPFRKKPESFQHLHFSQPAWAKFS